MLGNPTGLSGKYYLGVDTALDFGLGVSGHHRRRYASGLHLHADFLWHPVVVAQTDPFWLPLYFGIGARLLLDDHRDDRHDHIGVRAPLGLSMDFNNVPLDIFFELALVVDFINTHGHHGYVDLNAAIGIRYYF